MASRVCWNCDTKAHHTLMPGETFLREFPYTRFFGLFKCDECGYASMGSTPAMEVSSTAARTILDADRADLTWHPALAVGRHYADVPDEISRAADEAHRCYSIGAYRATLILARAVVEASAKAKGVTTGALFKKIETLHAQGIIREVIKDVAHDVRDAGNEMAHGDFVTQVSEEEAEEILFLMGKVLDDVFQTPAMTARRKAAKTARASSTAPGEENDEDFGGTVRV